MTIYAVGNNIPGYMPDCDEGFTTKDLHQAKAVLLEDLENYLDEIIEEPVQGVSRRFSGSQCIGFREVVAQVEKAEPQTCDVYIGDRVFFIQEV